MSAAQQIFLVAKSAQGGGAFGRTFFHRTTWGPRHPRGISVRNAPKTTFRAIWTTVTGGKVGVQPLNRQNVGLQLDTSPARASDCSVIGLRLKFVPLIGRFGGKFYFLFL